MDRNDQAWAVFRCQLLAPVLLGEVSASERGAYFRMLSQQEHLLPSGQRKKISQRTLRRWWQRLREGGVEATRRKRRSDRGQPHRQRDRAKILARAVQLKREQPRRSAHVINKILKHEFGRELPPTTLRRHLRRNGATRQKLGVSTKKVRCRWTREASNALWLGDFEHGPVIVEQGHAVKTHLSAWIDCHSRYIIEARYYVRENLDILIDSLLRAWGAHGASSELYLDNAKIYHAGGLKLACTQLNIRLLASAASRTATRWPDRAILSNAARSVRSGSESRAAAFTERTESGAAGLAQNRLSHSRSLGDSPDSSGTL